MHDNNQYELVWGNDKTDAQQHRMQNIHADDGARVFLIFDKTALLTSCGLIGQLLGALSTPALAARFENEQLGRHLDALVDHILDNLDAFRGESQAAPFPMALLGAEAPGPMNLKPLDST